MKGSPEPPRGVVPRGSKPERALRPELCLFLALLILAPLCFFFVRQAPPALRTAAEPEASSALEPPAPPASRVRVAAPTPIEGSASTQASRQALEPPPPAAREAPAPAGSPPTEQGTLEVVVLDGPAGQHVPAARVELRFFPEQAELGGPRTLLRTSDARGSVRASLPAGFLAVVAWSESGAGGPLEAEVEIGGTQRLELVLEPAYPIEGRVLDAATGEPVAGAEVAIWTFSEEDRVVSRADGTFSHPRFPSSPFAEQIRVTCTGYGPAVRYLEIDEHGGWDLPSSTEEFESLHGTGVPWVEVVLVPELRVQGEVRTLDGLPVACARVEAEGFYHVLPSVASRDGACSESDREGAFELGGLRSDIGHTLVLEAPGFAQRTFELAADLDGEIDLGTIRLEREVVLTGIVLDPEGAPAEDILVELYAREGHAPRAASGDSIDANVRVLGESLSARTNQDGVFEFPGLWPGEFSVSVARDAESVLEREVTLDGWESTGLFELRLPPESLTLVGQVRGAGGGIPGVQVVAERFGPVGRVTTDAQGLFRIAGLDDEAAYELAVQGACPSTGNVLVARTQSWGHDRPVLELHEP